MTTPKLADTVARKFLLPETVSTIVVKAERAKYWKIFSISAAVFGTLAFVFVLSKKWATSIYLVYLIPSVAVLYAIRAGIRIGVARESFWKKFAKINGWNYHNLDKSGTLLNSSFSISFPAYELFTLLVPEIRAWENRSLFKGKSVMLRQGIDRQIFHQVSGTIEGRDFRIFTYRFSIGIDKNRKLYFYTVFVFKFNGHFPHLYLNNKHNYYNVYIGENVPLPAEFSKQFTLSVPRKYEIEALEIFTPDVLESILDGGFTHDIELVDQELFFFSEGIINDVEKLEKEFTLALALEDILDEKLDQMKFEKIGDMPSVL